MQYITQALRDAVGRALAVDRAHQEQQYQNRLQQYEVAQAEWMEQHLATWATASKAIAAAVRKGLPVTKEMIPLRGNYDPRTFDVKHPGEFVYSPDVELKVVANALDLVPDEKIGVRDLNALGVRGSALRFVLSLAPVRGGQNTAVTE
jgi:hypothetical protein